MHTEKRCAFFIQLQNFYNILVKSNTIRISAKFKIIFANTPCPVFLALLGLDFLHKKYKIAPTVGIKNPSMPQPALPVSPAEATVRLLYKLL